MSKINNRLLIAGLFLLLPSLLFARQGSDKECRDIEVWIEHYTLKKQSGGTVAEMKRWNKMLQKYRNWHKENRCEQIAKGDS